MTSNSTFIIRPITPGDFAGTRDLYRHYIEASTASFEYLVPSQNEWKDRINAIILEYPWLILEYENRIIGYAYASKHRYRTAYSWSVESTVYIEQIYQGLGMGKVIYSALFDILRLQGYRNIYAGITLPNEKSVRLHQSMGFYEVGVFKKIGYKFGSWHDTGWFQMHLDDTGEAPGLIKSSAEVQSDPVFHEILNNAAHQLNIKYLENMNK